MSNEEALIRINNELHRVGSDVKIQILLREKALDNLIFKHYYIIED